VLINLLLGKSKPMRRGVDGRSFWAR